MSYSVKRPRCKQFFRVMRITTLLLFVFIFCMHAENSSSQNVNVTIKRSNTTLENVLNDIEKQTDFLFIYNKFVNVDRKVSVNLKKASLEEVLANLFAGTDVKYSVDGSYILLSAGGTTTTIPLSAQQGKMVSGVITDINGEPIIGANVIEKDSESVGTVTDVDGKFTLALDKPAATLVVSYIGYLTKEVPVGSQSVLKIILSEDTQNLEEVVVIGYGSVKKSDLTGAVGSIQVDKVQGISVKSVDQMLQGRTSGLYMVQNSGMPGASSTVRIRGGNSISGGNEPLYIIDGMPVYPSADASQTALSPLNSIPTSDIESIEVLKDASSTAIYGSRGANGVIIVTTKKGKSGKTSVAFDAYWGIQNIYKKYDLLDSRSFEKLANEALVNSGGAAIYDESLTPATTDWQDLTSNKNALTQNYQLTVSGGNDKTTFLASFNYFNQEGVIKASEMKKYAFRANIDHKISSTINLGLSLTMTKVDNNRVGNSVLQSRLTTPPNLPVMQDDGSYTFSDNNGVITFDNPVGVINEKVDWHTNFRSLNNAFVEWNIIKGLKFKSSFGIDIDYATNKSYNPRSVYSGSQKNGEAKKISNNTYTWINENILTYTNTWGVHSFTGMVGYTQQQSAYDGFNAGSYGFLNDNLQMNNLGSGTTYTAPGSEVKKWALNSYLARVNYTVNNKYLLTASIRADGSSRFGSDNRWGYFPSAALAWRASEESFIKDLNIFSNLKPRVSFGITGNQDGIGTYPAYALLGSNGYVAGGDKVTGYYPSQVANTNLKWETTAQFDAGIDFGFLGNALTFTVDYYQKKTNGMLKEMAIPNYLGESKPWGNVGSMKNEGVEFEVGYKYSHKDFRFGVNANLSYLKNKLVDLGTADGFEMMDQVHILGNVGRAENGMPYPYFYGYKTAGIFQNQAEIDAYTNSKGEKLQPLAVPGDVKFVDFDNDGTIDDKDKTMIGKGTPDWTFGLNLTAAYKDIDFSVLFSGSLGQDIMDVTRRLDVSSVNVPQEFMKRWHGEGTSNTMPRFCYPGDDMNGNWKKVSDLYVHNGSFARIKNMQIGYTLPKNLTRKFFVDRLRLYVAAENLLTLTSYKGLDPEINATDVAGDKSNGIDRGYYPQARTFTVGLNLNF
mgnify:CR=1 FL=1